MDNNAKRVTKDQKGFLIQYLEDHREFAQDRFTPDTGAKSLSDQLTALAAMLNSIGGAVL